MDDKKFYIKDATGNIKYPVTSFDNVLGLSEQLKIDWSANNEDEVGFIKNKPDIPSKTSQLINDSDFVNSEELINIISNKMASLIEIELDSSAYDDIINTEDGLINMLDRFTVSCNVTKDDFKKRSTNIKYVRIENKDKTRATLWNITFIMPEYGVFCFYSFNKLNENQIGIGYGTCSYINQTTIKISSIRSTMAIDGHENIAPEQ